MRTPSPSPPLPRATFDVEEIAVSLGVSTRHVRRAIWDGQLRALRSGRRLLIPADALADYIATLPAAVESR
jgi:excisionase family DNA binding protein